MKKSNAHQERSWNNLIALVLLRDAVAAFLCGRRTQDDLQFELTIADADLSALMFDIADAFDKRDERRQARKFAADVEAFLREAEGGAR